MVGPAGHNNDLTIEFLLGTEIAQNISENGTPCIHSL